VKKGCELAVLSLLPFGLGSSNFAAKLHEASRCR